MNEELEYAEMLEIPVETITVRRKEKKRKAAGEDLGEQLVDRVNGRMEQAEQDPAYAESTPIAREVQPKKRSLSRMILIGEFVAVCALCATIFFTNIFLSDSAINTFVRGLFAGNAETVDTRTYQDFTLSPVVSEYADVDIAVSDTGVLSFTAECSVYSPCAGEVASVNGSAEEGYSVEVRHSDSFSTIVSGLDAVYCASGDAVLRNVPIGFSQGEREVRVMLYSDGTLLNCYTVDGENGLAWS